MKTNMNEKMTVLASPGSMRVAERRIRGERSNRTMMLSTKASPASDGSETSNALVSASPS